MTKELKCGDLMPGCDAHFTAESEDEILAQAAQHAKEVHGLDVTPDLAEQVRSKIHDT